MAEKFLVPMKAGDRIEEIVPVLEKIAGPGAQVTFLFSYPVDTWTWLRDHWIVTESTARAVAEGKKIMARYSWEEQQRSAERSIAVARERLGRLGVETALALGASLSGAVRDYLLNADIQLILLSTANGNATIELARLFLLLLRRVKRAGVPAILLDRPGREAGREDSLASAR
ncbi:MAG TPA: hypothetical protein VGA73_04585 [Candidatus Binatia bacterium]